jgi:hypothetical protein
MTTPIEAHFSLKWLASAKNALTYVFVLGKRMATLERRVTELEAKMAKHPAGACSKCGELAMRVEKSWPLTGTPPNEVRYEEWKCKECGHKEQRAVRF